jgi:hypothetical protein
MIGHTVLYILAMLTIASILYVFYDSCDGFCCRKSQQTPFSVPKHANKSDFNLTDAITSEFPKENIVSIGYDKINSVGSQHIRHYPIQALGNLALQKDPKYKENKLVNRHKFKVFLINGNLGNANELYYSSYSMQALASPGAVLFMTNVLEGSEAEKAWARMVDENVIRFEKIMEHEGEAWNIGTFQNYEDFSHVCTSNLVKYCMDDYVKQHLGEEAFFEDTNIYYLTSEEREDELWSAYLQDVPNGTSIKKNSFGRPMKRLSVDTYEMSTVPSLYNGAMLKMIHPDLNITFGKETDEPRSKVLREFIQTHFKVV